MKQPQADWRIYFYEALVIISGLAVFIFVVVPVTQMISLDTQIELPGELSFLVLYVVLVSLPLFILLDLLILSFQKATVSLSFPITLVTLLALTAGDSSISLQTGIFFTIGLVIVGSFMSELLRRFSYPRLPFGRSTIRVLFYSGHHALAGAIAAYLSLFVISLMGSDNIFEFLPNAFPLAIIFAVVYAIGSSLLIWPHDWAVSRLLTLPDETPLPRIGLASLITITPLPFVLFILVFILDLKDTRLPFMLLFIFFLFLGFLAATGSYANIDVSRRKLKDRDSLRKRLGSPVNMDEIGRGVFNILNEEIVYSWAAVYSVEAFENEEDLEHTYYLRIRMDRDNREYHVHDVQSIIDLSQTRLPATVIKRENHENDVQGDHLTNNGSYDPSSVNLSNHTIDNQQNIVKWSRCISLSNETITSTRTINSDLPKYNVQQRENDPLSNSDPKLPQQIVASYLPIRHENKIIGLLLLARKTRQFDENDRRQLDYLVEVLPDSMWSIQQFEMRLQKVYKDVQAYTTDPYQFQKAMKNLADLDVDVQLVLDLIAQSAFRNNLVSVMQDVIQKEQAQDGIEGSKLIIADNILKDVYEEARERKPGMPLLTDEILENLKIIPSSLSLAFSFRFQWPEVSRGEQYIPLYQFFTKAINIKRVDRIKKLFSSDPADISKEPGITISKLTQDERFTDDLIVENLIAMSKIVNRLDQNLLLEAIEEIKIHQRSINEYINDPEKFIFVTLMDTWRTIIETTYLEIEGIEEMGRAQLEIDLRHQTSLYLPEITVGISVKNVGEGPALHSTITLLPDNSHQIIGPSELDLRNILAHVSRNIFFMVKPSSQEILKLQFCIRHQDLARESYEFNVNKELILRGKPPPYEIVYSPYMSGRPLTHNSSLFFGREDVFHFIQENMAPGSEQQQILLLIGERRIGKTSILKRLSHYVADSDYLYIFFDCQRIASQQTFFHFFHRLMSDINLALGAEEVDIPMVSDEALERNALQAFEEDFLPQLWSRLGQKRLLIGFDEYEGLDGRFDNPLRALMQNQPQIAMVFIGTHKLRERFSKSAGILFNIAKEKGIDFLTNEEATTLINNPVQDKRIFNDLAIVEILRSVSGHPYFLQLLCDRLMSRCNEQHRSYVTIQDVEAVRDEVLSSGQTHLNYIWETSDEVERATLIGLARSLTLEMPNTLDSILINIRQVDQFYEQIEIREALHHLQYNRQIVTRSSDDGNISYYNFKAYLYYLWIITHHSID